MSGSNPVLPFPLLSRKPVHVDFTGGNLSSDGGLLLLAQLDQQIGLTDRVAACIRDPRLPERVKHLLPELIRQRVYQIAGGYEDCNDANRLRGDPALKVAVGRCPVSDPDLASQSTLSRLEYTTGEEEVAAINSVLLRNFLECPRQAPKEVVLDFDPSEDPTHGQQELALFNGHYGGYCYLPLFVFARASGESEEFLISAELPESHGKETDMVIATLRRAVEALRAQWPGVKIIFRADAWFATPELMDWLEDNRVAFAIGMPSNSVLHEKSDLWRGRAEAAAARSSTRSARRFGEFSYRAKGWRQARRVVVKGEVTRQGPNPRYVLISGLRGTPRERYQYYGKRGGCENRIKELKEAIKSDRTSCMDFPSNKVRLMLHSVAYVLFQRLRRLARGTGLGHAQVERLRLALIRIAARIRETTRRVHVELCSTCPSQEIWCLLARRLGVSSG